MSEGPQEPGDSWWRVWLSKRLAEMRQREQQVILVLALVIGALTGAAVVAFILLTGRLGMRLYPVGSAPWRRLLFPIGGSLGIGPDSGWGCGGDCSRVQYSTGGGGVCARGDYGGPQRPSDGRGRTGLGDLLDGSAVAPRQQSSL
jgi:hypothetical protein